MKPYLREKNPVSFEDVPEATVYVKMPAGET